jgi:hypothetical protein
MLEVTQTSANGIVKAQQEIPSNYFCGALKI